MTAKKKPTKKKAPAKTPRKRKPAAKSAHKKKATKTSRAKPKKKASKKGGHIPLAILEKRAARLHRLIKARGGKAA